MDRKNPPLASQDFLSESLLVDQYFTGVFSLNYFAFLLVMLVFDVSLKFPSNFSEKQKILLEETLIKVLELQFKPTGKKE